MPPEPSYVAGGNVIIRMLWKNSLAVSYKVIHLPYDLANPFTGILPKINENMSKKRLIQNVYKSLI